MKKLIVYGFMALGVLGASVLQAQTAAVVTPDAPPQSTAVAERTRINAERLKLETAFTTEDAACHKKFLVNRCLDEVKVRRRDALADLRRQEISLNAEDRHIKGAEQIRKTEEKSSPQRQQEAADRRTEALTEFQARQERAKQKNEDRVATDAEAKSNIEAAAGRVKASQDKASARSVKQAASIEEARKFNERVAKAKERQARHDRDQSSQTKPTSKSLPVPE